MNLVIRSIPLIREFAFDYTDFVKLGRNELFHDVELPYK